MRRELARPPSQELRVIITPDGALITHVDEEGPVAELGLEPGDTIESIFGYPIHSADTLRRMLSGDNGFVRLGIRDNRSGKSVVKYGRLI